VAAPIAIGGGVMIATPIQAIDTSNPSAPTVQVLGLTVNVSQALILNNDDDGPLNISQVAAGQFAFLMLPSNQTPLSATFLGVHQVQIKVRAPLTAVNCGSTSSTIAIALGLNVDITNASLYNARESTITCDDLAAMPANQVVTVTLASDTPNSSNVFTATEVETAKNNCYDSNCGNVMIFAPLQAIDTSNPSAPTVQVLGLPIDIANAFPQCDAGNCSITLNQWEVGEFAMLILPSTQTPLSASFMWVHLVEIKVKAPLTAVNCSATPPTITVLGLNIDISNTNLYNNYGSAGCGWNNNLTCANLMPGQEVTVTLSSDTPNSTTNLFPATKIEIEEGCCWFGWCNFDISNVKIAAPIQTISGTIVTVLEQLNIDTKNAILELDNGLPMNASQLAVGQFVKLTLVPNTSSPSALILVAQASAVQATVQLLDNKGKKVNDSANDITAQVTVGLGKHARVYNFSNNGTFYLSGLPAGTAKIVVTRVYNGQKSTGSGSFTVNAVKANNKKGYNKPQYLTIRLKPVRQ
jgi:hypothetical protein